MSNDARLADPTPAEECDSAHIPYCQSHLKIERDVSEAKSEIKGLRREFKEWREDEIAYRSELVQLLAPRPVGDTLPGRIVGLLAANPAAVKILAVAVLVASLGVGGYALTDLRGIAFLPAVADDAAGENASDGNDIDDGGASALDSPTPGESQP